MAGFEDAWLAVTKSRHGELASLALKPYLRSVYMTLQANPPNLVDLKTNLEDLLQFLSTEGRTDANCWAVDLFFAESEDWERDWVDNALPDDFHDVLAMMGQALHDTVQAQKIAANFECLPEQLLARVKRIRIDDCNSKQH